MPICSIPYAQACQSTVHHMHMYANLQNSIHTSVLIYRIAYAQVYQSTVCHPHKYANLQDTIHTSMPVYSTPHAQVCQSHNRKEAAPQSCVAMWDGLTSNECMGPTKVKQHSTVCTVFLSWKTHCDAAIVLLLIKQFLREEDGSVTRSEQQMVLAFQREKQQQKQANPPKSKQSLWRIYNAQHTVQTPCFHQSRQGKNVAIHWVNAHTLKNQILLHTQAGGVNSTSQSHHSMGRDFTTDELSHSLQSKNPSSSGHFRLGRSVLCKLDRIHLSPPANRDSIHNSQWPIRTQLLWQDMAGCPSVVAEHWLG